MKIRVLSDLHVDVNEMCDYHRDVCLDDKGVFTVIAGDTAGTPEAAINWIRQNIKQGIVIAGNHIVYDANKRPVQELKQQMADAFPEKSPITFLDHMTGTMSKEVNNILFIGTTLYTDYALYPDISVEWAMRQGWRNMNDFRSGYTKDRRQKRSFNPKDYRRWFIESKKEITRIVEANPDKEIVIITHHCPSEKCCQYPQEVLNTSYASNLEPFIQKHPNIKLWITGHVHDRKNFKIGNCLVLMNPRGYEFDGEGIDFNPNTFVDTKDWSVQQEPIRNGLTQDQKKSLFRKLLERACFEL